MEIGISNTRGYLVDPLWYSPRNVIYYFKELDQTSILKASKKYRKALEAFRVAVMLVGIRLLQNREYWQQLVSDDEGSPDIRTGCYKFKKGTPKNTWVTQEVEVVTFDEHSSGSLIDFLKRTKLTKKKSYDKLTTILCFVDKNTREVPLELLHNEIRKVGLNNPVIIVGKCDPLKEVYRIAQINPTLELVTEFDLQSELLSKKYIGVLKLKRGLKPGSGYDKDDKHYPFEKIGILPK